MFATANDELFLYARPVSSAVPLLWRQAGSRFRILQLFGDDWAQISVATWLTLPLAWVRRDKLDLDDPDDTETSDE